MISAGNRWCWYGWVNPEVSMAAPEHDTVGCEERTPHPRSCFHGPSMPRRVEAVQEGADKLTRPNGRFLTPVIRKKYSHPGCFPGHCSIRPQLARLARFYGRDASGGSSIQLANCARGSTSR